MEELVSSYFCEWTETINDPERRKQFQQFANVDETVETVESIVERDQPRPSNWPKDAAKVDFKGTKWSSLAWQPILEASKFRDIATGDSQQVKRGDTQLAIFKVRGKYYCTQQMCPHKRAFVLSDGLIGEADNKLWVSCPYHKRNYEIAGSDAGKCANDEELNIATFQVEEREDGWVYVQLPSIEELDSVLGTEKWKVKKEEASSDEFQKVDEGLKASRDRKVRRDKGDGINLLKNDAIASNGVASNGTTSNGIDW
jgi:nitrite reductase (NAD(P)H)